MTMENLRELADAVSRGEREPAEAVAVLKARVVYPRFLGADNYGDHVYELEDGRWTWAHTPDHAIRRPRSFEPEYYVTTYGVPTPIRTPDEIEADAGKEADQPAP